MNDFLFYRLDHKSDLAEPAEFDVDIWEPSWRSLQPPGADSPRWLVWWAFDRTLVFRRRWYAVVTIRSGEQVVHQSVLFPRFFRFPTVAKDELQIGDVWTDPAYRGKGLARLGIGSLANHALQKARCVWYITEETNAASRSAAEGCGFVLAGRGHRESRFGLRVLGRYVLDNAG